MNKHIAFSILFLILSSLSLAHTQEVEANKIPRHIQALSIHLQALYIKYAESIIKNGESHKETNKILSQITYIIESTPTRIQKSQSVNSNKPNSDNSEIHKSANPSDKFKDFVEIKPHIFHENVVPPKEEKPNPSPKHELKLLPTPESN
jgi:hypothetical protein